MIESTRMTGQALGLPTGTRALVCLNVGYIAGMMMMVRGLELGWELTVVEPSSNPLMNLDETVEFDFVSLVPLQLSSILSEQRTSTMAENLGKILLGGGAVPMALMSGIHQLKIPVYQSYGMTETVSHVALRRLNGANSQGNYKILPGIDSGTDERGCLYLRGAVTANQLIQTNDLVEITSPDSFNWVGRVDSVINSGGVKISLDKLDGVVGEVLQEMNAANDYFCWYQADDILGQKLVIFIKRQNGIFDSAGLINKISDHVKPYETPKAVYFVQKFEQTPTGKIDKIATAHKYFDAIHE
ncbi:AMP-binding protein [Persicitalea jodogahamensis]|nr:AMP-binding protein [Persicitalea jodogahamensis]